MSDPGLVRDIVGAAVQAPSAHNAQPWRFVAHGDVIELWADPSRALPVLDPHGRAAHLSCGAALLFARVDAASKGLSGQTALLPDLSKPDHLADLTLGTGRVEPELATLRPAIDTRHTDRGTFDESTPVPADLLRALADAVQVEGSWLRVVSNTSDSAAVAVLLSRADDVQSADPDYRAELGAWTGRSDDSPDGVPSSAVPTVAPSERGSNYRLRDFDADREAAGPRWAGEPPLPEHPAVVVLGTADDDAAAWLRAGGALGRLLLTATASGLAASPMTQALEVDDTRARLVQELGLVGHPQMVLRIGFRPADDSPPLGHSLRRPVDEILEMR